MDLLYQYHYLMNQAAEYRWLAVNQALLSAANKSPSCDESWNIVAQYAQGNSTTVRECPASFSHSHDVRHVKVPSSFA